MINTVYHLLVKNNKGRGGGVGAHKPSSPDKVGLFREGEGGGGGDLIEDLRYVWPKEYGFLLT